MSKHIRTNGSQNFDNKLAAAEQLVQKLGSLEKAKQAIEELEKLQKAA